MIVFDHHLESIGVELVHFYLGPTAVPHDHPSHFVLHYLIFIHLQLIVFHQEDAIASVILDAILLQGHH